MATFSDRLKELRKSKNLKQTDMAVLLEITTRHYQDFNPVFVSPSFASLSQFGAFFTLLVSLYDCRWEVVKETLICKFLLFSYSVDSISDLSIF